MRTIIALIAISISSHAAHALCGDQGGPAFRQPNRKCAAWATLERVCGSPPTTRCEYEGGGLGDTGIEKGKSFIAGMGLLGPTGSGSAQDGGFGDRTTKREGIACTSQTTLAQVAQCSNARSNCKATLEGVLASGQCAWLPSGTRAKIEAGSHSFDWVRIKAQGQSRLLWTEQSLVLD